MDKHEACEQAYKNGYADGENAANERLKKCIAQLCARCELYNTLGSWACKECEWRKE